MGKLLRAGFAFLVAWWLIAPDEAAAHFDTPGLRAAKAELKADRPGEKLWSDAKVWLAGGP